MLGLSAPGARGAEAAHSLREPPYELLGVEGGQKRCLAEAQNPPFCAHKTTLLKRPHEPLSELGRSEPVHQYIAARAYYLRQKLC